MKLTSYINRLFLKLRGDTGADLSRGPLSDIVRNAAVAALVECRDGTCLEVGVGEGLLADDVRERGAFRRFIGVDISAHNLYLAGKRIPDGRFYRGVCALAHRLPFRPGAVERVVCVNTLYNQRTWEEIRAIICELGLLTNDGGSFLFDIRNARDPLISTIYRVSRIIDPSTRRLEIHAYPYRRVKRMLEENGFVVKRRIPVYYPFWFIPSAFVIEAGKAI
jgi:ubiquinone/menaquinone biosynthesis C-methylase UbiE